jgi:hypothetical protein
MIAAPLLSATTMKNQFQHVIAGKRRLPTALLVICSDTEP